MKTLTTLLFCMIMAGCVTHGEYPDDWPELEQPLAENDSECPGISGTYWDQSLPTDTTQYRRATGSLTRFLVMSGGDEDPEVPSTTVDIVQPSNSMIYVKAGNAETVSLSSEEGDFICQDNMIIFDGGTLVDLFGIGLGVMRTKFALHKSNDGSLILESKEAVAGAGWYYIPLVMIGTHGEWVSRWLLEEDFDPELFAESEPDEYASTLETTSE